ncbi:MFS_1 domain-containing protein [Rhizoctonia solani AG-1 IA]|uniref:MFS_1 domain-containing protein n=1 Tax=Thanatephorus cucumeris (strain AG1-IA) TaxID=983506 RepID=L8X2E6_THACA|nr:MFS_1 domain-containing protein [Rhizoctonia solani AG-1 IA]
MMYHDITTISLFPDLTVPQQTDVPNAPDQENEPRYKRTAAGTAGEPGGSLWNFDRIGHKSGPEQSAPRKKPLTRTVGVILRFSSDRCRDGSAQKSLKRPGNGSLEVPSSPHVRFVYCVSVSNTKTVLGRGPRVGMSGRPPDRIDKVLLSSYRSDVRAILFATPKDSGHYTTSSVRAVHFYRCLRIRVALCPQEAHYLSKHSLSNSTSSHSLNTDPPCHLQYHPLIPPSIEMAISMPCSPSSDSTFSEPSSRASTPTLVPSQLGADDKFDDGRSITESLISSLASDTTDVERNSKVACHTCVVSNLPTFGSTFLDMLHRLAVCLFLAITDTTIVSTSLPTINAELGGTSAQYSWVGLHVDTDDISTRIRTIHNDVRPQAHLGYVVQLSAYTQSMRCLVIARALQGVGGGGIVTLIWVILEEVAPAKTRHRWNAALSAVWSMSALAGPLMGGVFSVYMNLPVGCAALIAAMISLSAWHEAPCNKSSIGHLLGHFDWVGLVLLVGGTAALVIGFSLATIQGWSSTLTLALVFAGIASLILGALYESGIFGATRCWGLSLGANPKHALFAPMLLRTRAADHGIQCWNLLPCALLPSESIYWDQYVRPCSNPAQAVHGSSALHAGTQLLPYTLGSSLVSLIGFYISEKTKAHITIIRAGLGLMATGFGLMILLDERSSMIMQTLIPLVAGVGVGFLLKTPATALSLAMRGCDVPAVTAGLLLVRFIGTASGVVSVRSIFISRCFTNDILSPSEVRYTKADWLSTFHRTLIWICLSQTLTTDC